jgi:DNA-binding CsgD family transcriptional regulator
MTLLEREPEVERIRGLLRVADRGNGRTLVIEGAPGIGKSRLLGVARARAEELSFRILAARATEFEQGFPFGVARQLFERLLRDADAAQRERWLAGAASLSITPLLQPPAEAAGVPSGAAGPDSGYAWQHGLYWLASNLSAEAPLALIVDDLQWCDASTARALAFIARRLEGLPIVVFLATRPPDPVAAPEAAMIVADQAHELLRPSALTPAGAGALIGEMLSATPSERFVRECHEMTGGNPFLLGELLDEARARGTTPTAATEVRTLVPRGVASTVLLRLARLPPPAATLARALSALGDGAYTRDAGGLAELSDGELLSAMAALVSSGVIEPGDTIRFAHPLLRAAIYDDLTVAERQHLHHSAASIMRARGAASLQIATHVMHTDPAGDPAVVTLLRDAAREALRLGDAAEAARLLGRALTEPPEAAEHEAVLFELGKAHARAGSAEAIGPLREVVEHADDPADVTTAAIELSGLLFYAGRGAEAVAIGQRARERTPADTPARAQLDAAVLGGSYTSVSARVAAEPMITELTDPGGPAHDVAEATILATLALDEVMYLRSASRAIDLAERALAARLPGDPQRGENWAVVALASLAASGAVDEALAASAAILTQARRAGAALAVASMSALRAGMGYFGGDLPAVETDAYAAIDLAAEFSAAGFHVLAVAAAVLAGLERDQTPESLSQLIARTGAHYDDEFLPGSQLRFASGALRAAAGNHADAVVELRSCGSAHATFGGENPAVLPWRSAAALSLAELGRHDEARELADDELRRARSFGAARAIGMALRARALVGAPKRRETGLREAVEVLAPSSGRLEHARALVDLGATLRAQGQRTAAREPLLVGLDVAATCGALSLERRARTELAAIGLRPRTSARGGADALTPSERRVAELAAAGETNRTIAQELFVTEKTVETHLGRAYRKLNITSRRQLRDVLLRSLS